MPCAYVDCWKYCLMSRSIEPYAICLDVGPLTSLLKQCNRNVIASGHVQTHFYLNYYLLNISVSDYNEGIVSKTEHNTLNKNKY